VFEIKLSADEIVSGLLRLSEREPVHLLDSCGVGHLGSHLLIAGIRPAEILEISGDDPDQTLRVLDDRLSRDLAAIFTLSYDFGKKLLPESVKLSPPDAPEPDAFIALFEALVVHDYDMGRTFVVGNAAECPAIAAYLERECRSVDFEIFDRTQRNIAPVVSNFTNSDYVGAVELIQEYIRRGDTYQTNLTQQLRCELEMTATPESIYWRLRRDHPAPFAAFLRRSESTVISASPERFFRTTRNGLIESSPIKGTRRRGDDPEEDHRLREELLSSEKDRAENTMIVDLVRNDLGRVCEYGSVAVEKLCDIEEHPTLFHLVSTVRGKLRESCKFSSILRAVFPCGSITGAPKIRTMQIIDEIESSARGLSMGAIGVYLPESWDFGSIAIDTVLDLSVAIRTMVVRDGEAAFNVGGGVVIDSDPEKEYAESLLKARAWHRAIGPQKQNTTV
jgi:para-aminobenzoate synthetase component 1